ncbi:MAG: MBOAT family protein [Clostridiales bacterium]|nr:MBOAT family protein [Clostridiales bacterium]
MSLVSISFLFFLLPAALVCFYAVPAGKNALRGAVLLAFSLLFVFLVQPKALAAALLTCAVCYACGAGISRAKTQAARRAWCVSGIVLCVGALCFYKYAALLASVFGVTITLPGAPAGVSFFTFLAVSYLVDVARGACAAEQNPAKLALYFTAFPKFLQGPLTRYGALRDALFPARPGWNDAAQGAERICIGLGKKLLLATAAQGAAERLLDGSAVSCPAAWLGAACYALQIYFDFSGYTDMAIGLGALFGLNLPENFNDPYCARSITDFWRRWHMTLSQWFRDYIYIPLGGSRRGKPRQILNLLIVWGLTGLWHGASWNFALWGLYFAVLLIVEKLVLVRILNRLPAFFRHIYALFFILLGWVLFRTEDFSQLAALLRTLFTGGAAVTAEPFVFVLRQYGIELLLGALLCTPLGKRFLEMLDRTRFGRVVKYVLLLAIFALALLALVRSGVNAFIYAQF